MLDIIDQHEHHGQKAEIAICLLRAIEENGLVAILSRRLHMPYTVGLVLAGGQQTVLSITGSLLVTIVGGVLIGGVVTLGFMLLAGRTADYLVEITFTTLAAYGSFFVAEHYRCSGVLAAWTAGLVVGNYHPSGALSDAGRPALETFWEYLAFLANSLIFILIGAQEAESH